MIQAPPGWTPPKEDKPPAAKSKAGTRSKTPLPPSGGSAVDQPTGELGVPPTAPPLPVAAQLLDDSSEIVPPPRPDEIAASAVELPVEVIDTLAVVAPPRPSHPWLAQYRILLAGAPLVAIVLAVAVWIVVSSRPAEGPPGGPPKQVETPVVADPSRVPEAKPQPSPRLDLPWTPDGTKLVVKVRLSQLQAMPDSDRFVSQLGATWRATVGAVVQGFGLNPQAVRDLSWACTDLAAWPDQSVVVIALEANQDAHLLTTAGKPLDFALAGQVCYRRPESSWPHPFAVINAQTIVTGNEALLRHLAHRGQPALASKPIERLCRAMSASPLLGLQVDLTAARALNWRVPEQWLDVWPAGRRAWRAAWENSEGFGCMLDPSEQLRTGLFFACEGTKTAERVRTAVDELMPQIRTAINARLESLAEKLRSNQAGPNSLDQYAVLLEEILAAVGSVRMELAGETVCVRFGGKQSVSPVVKAGLESTELAQADWLGGALAVDRSQHGRLGVAMNDYRKARGHYPAADVGEGALPPETRLSWIATLLPHLGHEDWHKRLEFGYSWNGEKNSPVTRQVLPAVVNPALGPHQQDGYPVTHYVGVAGVGADAATLKADDPRAGVFGHGRTMRAEDIPAGASNTIAVLGVTGKAGAWAAGGSATVRPLTKAPYVNGPDGFGSGQPDGMLAGMADGSVRFISKDVDPRVLEQLATVHGRKDVNVAALDRKPPTAEPSPQTPAPPDQPPTPKNEPAPAKPQQPVPAREPLPTVDVAQRLTHRIAEIEMRDTPLVQFVRLVGDLSGLAITLDADALVRLGIAPSDPVTVQLAHATTREILEKGVAKCGLAVVVVDNGVVVTMPPSETLKTVRYRVDDLVSGDPVRVAQLVTLTTELVSPNTWHAAGGRGSVTADGDALKVEQTDAVHDQVLAFCERLRRARNLPLRSQSNSSRMSLETRTDRAAAMLGRSVTISFPKPAPLSRIISTLEEVGATTVLVDWSPLRSERIAPQTLATMRTHDQPLGVALDSLLQPLGLAYRVVDAKLLQVTTRRANALHWELEFHPAADLVKRLTGPALLNRLKASVAKESWREAGGQAAAAIDEPSGCLLVTQSQPVQVAIGQLLKELRAERKP